MRVGDGSIDNPGSGSVGSVGGAGSDGSSSAAAGKTKSDSVNLAGAASLVALAKAAVSSRQSKVESIGSQVKSGSYQSDNAQVSHAIVEDHISS